MLCCLEERFQFFWCNWKGGGISVAFVCSQLCRSVTRECVHRQNSLRAEVLMELVHVCALDFLEIAPVILLLILDDNGLATCGFLGRERGQCCETNC